MSVLSSARRAGLLCAGAALATFAAASLASGGESNAWAGAAAKKPVVLCWNKDYPEPVGDGDAQVRVKPRKCALFKRGEAANFAAVRVQSLDWNRWGSRRAVGVGKNCSPMSGTCSRVEVKLTRVVERCGRRVFSKARFEFAGGTAPDPDFQLYTC